MKNNYEIRGDITAIFLNRKVGDIVETLIETKDLPIADSIEGTWCCHFDRRTQSIYAKHSRRGMPALRLHRLLMEEPIGLEVDHINHDSLDNRRINLRSVTRDQNRQNLSGAFSNNKSSGMRNVHWHKEERKWQVTVGANKKRHYIGKFAKLEDAQIAAIEARKKYQIS